MMSPRSPLRRRILLGITLSLLMAFALFSHPKDLAEDAAASLVHPYGTKNATPCVPVFSAKGVKLDRYSPRPCS